MAGGKKKGTNVAKAIVTVIPSMEGARKEIESELSKTIVQAARDAGDAGGKVLGESLSEGASKEVKSELPKSVSESAPEVKAAVKSTLESAVNSTVSTPVKNGVKAALSSAMGDVNESAKSTVNKLFSSNIVSTLKKSIPTGLTSGFENARNVVKGSVDKALDVGKDMAESVKSKLPEGMVTAVSNAKAKISGAVSNVFGGSIKEAIKSKLPTSFTDALNSVKSSIKNLLGKTISTGVGDSLKSSLGDAFRNGLASAKSAIKNGLSSLFHGSISEAVKTSVPTAFSDGLSTVKLALGNMLGNVFTSAVQTASAAIKETLSEAFYGFADFQQLEGGVETLFKGSADVVKKNAARAFETAGLSANEYMDNVTSFSAALISGLGGDTEKAAEIADKAMQDMADNANKMGTDMGSIQMAYQSFAKNNYTLLDNLKLGFGGTQAEMARLVNEAGVMGDDFVADAKNINEVPFDKIIEAIHVVQERMDITGTTSKEAATTISGSIGMMKSSWSNFLTGLANPDADMSQLSHNLVSSLKTVVENVKPAIRQMFTGIFEGVVDVLREMGQDGAADFISSFAQGLDNDTVKNALGSFQELFQTVGDGLGRLFDGFDGSKAADVVTKIADGIGFLNDTLKDLWPFVEYFIGNVKDSLSNIFGDVDVWEVFKNVIGGIGDVMKTFFVVVSEQILPALENVIGTIGDGLGDMFGDVDVFQVLKDVVYLVGDAFAFVLNTIAQLWPVIEPLINLVKDVGVTAFEALYAAITSEEAQGLIENVIELLGNVSQTIADLIGGMLPDSETLSGVLETVFGVISDIIGVINDNWPAIKEVIDTVAEVAGTVLGTLWEILQKIGETISAVAEEVAKNLNPDLEGLNKISFDNLMESIKGIADIVKDIVFGAMQWIQDHGEEIGAIIGGIVTAAEYAFATISAIVRGIVEVVKWLLDVIDTIRNGVDDIAGKLFPDLDISKGNPLGLLVGGLSFFAEGGVATQPSIAGEAGPELIWPEYNPYFDKYAAGIASHLDDKTGGDTYIIVDGAVVNSSDAMKQSFYDNMMELKRLGVMQSGSAS